jgi:acetyl-CoA decarbonylase/synthase complex subunit epsilon
LSNVTAWETAEIRGPKVASMLAPENCGRMLKISKRLLIVVGGEAIEMKKDDGVDVPKVVSRIAKSRKGVVVTSPGVFNAFNNNPELKVINMGLEDVVSRLQDKSWKGFDGQGAYDMIVFIGGIYYFQSMMLSTLKHFAPKLRTISIDRFYHPNAGFSLANLTSEKWKEGLEALLKPLEAN